MPLLIAGIDEAGYGPLLGPLCVGMSVLRVREWAAGDEAPNLWRTLSRAVCRTPGKSRRIAIDDSKKLKLPNDDERRHPLTHLERGVLSFLRARDVAPATDTELFGSLGVDLAGRPWYEGGTAIPVAWTATELALAANMLIACLEKAGVEVVELRCLVLDEDAFNDVVRRTGTKGEATLTGMGAHLAHVLQRYGGREEWIRVVCDQLGGRTHYAEALSRHTGFEVRALEESGRRSRYQVGDERTVVQLQPEGDSAHFTIALASMVAKYVRELAMARFNRYWNTRIPELKPTAGYSQDARRWLRDARDMISDEDRRALIRIA